MSEDEYCPHLNGMLERSTDNHLRLTMFMLYAVLRDLKLKLTDDQCRRITSCEDVGQLETWMRRAEVVSTADELLS